MNFDVEEFLSAVSEAEPCGPDLDESFDADYLNFTARMGLLIPETSYFSFDRNSIDFKKEALSVSELLARSRDLRLMVLHAKLAILDRDVESFVRDVEIIAALLEQRWNDVHPRGESGDFVMRVQTVQSLDDGPASLMPLQHAPLFQTRRTGPISWRSMLIADGKLSPREGETVLDAGQIERAFLEIEPAAVAAVRGLFARLVSAVERIEAASFEHGDLDNRIGLEKLGDLARAIEARLANGASVGAAGTLAGDVSASAAVDGGATPSVGVPAEGDGPLPPIAARRDARAAMKAAKDYFAVYEPNSPALLLLRFADKTAELPFHELVHAIMPDIAGRASIPLAKSTFRLSLDRARDAIGDEGRESSEDETVGDGAAFRVTTRRGALRLIDALITWYQSAEPSSPIPLFLSRARDLAERDFSSLLRELFSESALDTLKGDDWR